MPKTKPTTQNAEMPHHHNVGAETEKEEQESKISRTLQQPSTSCLSFSNWSFALNRRRGDAHKLDRKTGRLVNTAQQGSEILLCCPSFSNSDPVTSWRNHVQGWMTVRECCRLALEKRCLFLNCDSSLTLM